MRLVLPSAARPAAATPSEEPIPNGDPAAARLIRAANVLLASLERGGALDARALREAMTQAFGATDSEGAWVWKDAYEACEAAQLLFVRRHFAGMRTRAGSSARLLAMLARLAALTPTHTRRSEESQQLQQFSTPVELAFIAGLAAQITPADFVLEPSAGTGQLAIFAQMQGAELALNEIAATRADLLALLFEATPVTCFNAEHIHDYLPEPVRPSVILMNPPFSAALNIKGSVAGTDLHHVRSALQRLAPGGRLVAITGIDTSPEPPGCPRRLAGPRRSYRLHRRSIRHALPPPRHHRRNPPHRHRPRSLPGVVRPPSVPADGRDRRGAPRSRDRPCAAARGMRAHQRGRVALAGKPASALHAQTRVNARRTGADAHRARRTCGRGRLCVRRAGGCIGAIQRRPL